MQINITVNQIVHKVYGRRGLIPSPLKRVRVTTEIHGLIHDIREHDMPSADIADYVRFAVEDILRCHFNKHRSADNDLE